MTARILTPAEAEAAAWWFQFRAMWHMIAAMAMLAPAAHGEAVKP